MRKSLYLSFPFTLPCIISLSLSSPLCFLSSLFVQSLFLSLPIVHLLVTSLTPLLLPSLLLKSPPFTLLPSLSHPHYLSPSRFFCLSSFSRFYVATNLSSSSLPATPLSSLLTILVSSSPHSLPILFLPLPLFSRVLFPIGLFSFLRYLSL